MFQDFRLQYLMTASNSESASPTPPSIHFAHGRTCATTIYSCDCKLNNLGVGRVTGVVVFQAGGVWSGKYTVQHAFGVLSSLFEGGHLTRRAHIRYQYTHPRLLYFIPTSGHNQGIPLSCLNPPLPPSPPHPPPTHARPHTTNRYGHNLPLHSQESRLSAEVMTS